MQLPPTPQSELQQHRAADSQRDCQKVLPQERDRANACSKQTRQRLQTSAVECICARAESRGQLTPGRRPNWRAIRSGPIRSTTSSASFTDFSEIHGDRGFADDAAIVCGMARFHGEEVAVVGTQKGRDTKQRVYRNFGTAAS